MEDDELQPRNRLSAGGSLESFSVDELRAYEAALQQELERVRALLKSKVDYLSGAESLFKS